MSQSHDPPPPLSLAPFALALGDQLGQAGKDNDPVGDIWNVITRAADLAPDGQRIENLAWRTWAQSRRLENRARRASTSSADSSCALLTPATEVSSYFPQRSFGGTLRLVLKDDASFKDWVGDARKQLPIIALPDTPVANVEIRLVEPTPAPSRVGSLGASLAAGGLRPTVGSLVEEDEEEEDTAPQAGKKKGKFFVQSSPSRAGSGSESSHPSPVSPIVRRKSSASSQEGRKVRRDLEGPRRNVSLSTMKGKFQAEKRRIAQTLKAKNEDSGWEDEDVDNDWSDESSSSRRRKQLPPPPAPTPLIKMSKKERQAAAEERARIEAELEAQRKREMFAKQQIFGKSTPGLLTGIFKSGGSMVDLTQAAAPPPAPPASTLLRSKSAVAVPIQTGISVMSTGQLSKGSESDDMLQRKPPDDVELETDESGDEDDTLASSSTERKLAERTARDRARAQSQPVPPPADMAISPTTRRRTIIMREMSESLRRNLILEREKSSGPSRLRQTRPETVSPPPARRSQTILGTGFLKPLTRTSPIQPDHGIMRAQSSANLTAEVSPTGPSPESVAMARSSTDGESRRRDMLRKRSPVDNGYRSHGW